MFQQALQKLKAYMKEEEYADKKVRGLDVNHITDTDIERTTKQRVGQDVLRNYLLDIYNYTCALCHINKADLLVCSHNVPYYLIE